MVSCSNKFIFIHITKTGGTSIIKMLDKYWDDLYEQHETALECQKRIGNNLFNQCFKFAFVRNPWDKMVSTYHWRKQHKYGIHDSTLHGLSFNDWVLNTAILDETKQGTTSQLFWIQDKNATILVDFIGKFENYDRDWNNIKSILQVLCQYVHLNNSRHMHYKNYYNKKTKKVIEQRFQEDIEFFKYVY